MRAIRPDNRVSLRQKQGCVEVSSYSRHWPCLFPQHGPSTSTRAQIELAEVAAGDRGAANPGDFASRALPLGRVTGA